MKNVLLKQVENLIELKEIIVNFNCDFMPSIEIMAGNLQIYSEKLYNNAVNIKASCNNEIIGFCSFYCNDKVNLIAYLTLIAVKEEVKGTGVSQLLLDEVEKICLVKEIKKLKLEVNCNNLPAITFYKKNGFEVSGIASENTRYMEKVLKKI